MRNLSESFYKSTTKREMEEIIRQLIYMNIFDDNGEELGEDEVWQQAIDERNLLRRQGFFNNKKSEVK